VLHSITVRFCLTALAKIYNAVGRQGNLGLQDLCSGLRCLNPAIGQCGDNGSGRMTGVPLKSEFLSSDAIRESSEWITDSTRTPSIVENIVGANH
jgi:hypothetical protein